MKVVVLGTLDMMAAAWVVHQDLFQPLVMCWSSNWRRESWKAQLKLVALQLLSHPEVNDREETTGCD